MDSAVGLVQAYLRVNGYFTATEVPVFAARGGHSFSTLTDLDVLAFRFPGAGHPVLGEWRAYVVDPDLGCPNDRSDMLIGEVKEGKAELNGAARRPAVLAAVLARFGCCTPKEASHTARELIQAGSTDTHQGHRVRLVAFGSRVEPSLHPSYHRVPLGRVVGFLEEHLAAHWSTLGHTQLKDPALGILLAAEKARRGLPAKSKTTAAQRRNEVPR